MPIVGSSDTGGTCEALDDTMKVLVTFQDLPA
jgi:hypothetical protein